MIGHGPNSRLSRPFDWKGGRTGEQASNRAETLLYLLNTVSQVETLTRALDACEQNDTPLWLALALDPKERLIGTISANTIDLINRGLRGEIADILNAVIETLEVDKLDDRILSLFANVVRHRYLELSNGIPFMWRVVEHAAKTHNTNSFVFERDLAFMERETLRLRDLAVA